MALVNRFNQPTDQNTPQRRHLRKYSMTSQISWIKAGCSTGSSRLLDISAVFDIINPDVVINTLEHNIGVRGVALSWFKNYLNKRNQRIRIGITVSKPAALSRGVPQGSVLGPVLFTSYTILIAAICKRHGVKYHIYTDDTQLYITFDPTIPGDREHALEK